MRREQRVEQLSEIRGDAVQADWGQQVRSYVLAPYKMVKDLRSQHETSQVPAAPTRTICDPLAACSDYPRAPVLTASPCLTPSYGRPERGTTYTQTRDSH